MTPTTRSIGLFVASLMLGISLPLASAPSLIASTQYSTAAHVRRTVTQKDRQDLSVALQMYAIRLQKGETGLVKPDINSRASIDFYLKNPVEDRILVKPIRTDPVSTSDYVKPPEESVADDAITVQERTELARAAKVGRCWNFPGFSAGYMTLCKKFIEGKAPINTVGLTNDIQNAKVLQQAVLRGSATGKKNLFDGLKDNRSGPRTPYGKNGGRAADASSSSRGIR